MKMYLALGPVSFPDVIQEESWNSEISVQTTIVGESFFETYTVAVNDPKNNYTVGTFSWIFSYQQTVVLSSPSQTTIPILQGRVTTATGPFYSYSNCIIIGNFDNNTGDRNFVLKSSS